MIEKSDTRPAIGAARCPFCASTDIHNWVSADHGDTPAWSVMCFGCECEGPHVSDELEAIRAVEYAAVTEFTISGRDQYGKPVTEDVTLLPKTRVLVTGGRNYADRARVFQILDAAITRLNLGFLIQGGATGADAMAKEWAEARNILNAEYAADWSLGKSAGPRRNAQMLREGKPDIVIAFPGGSGTHDMVERAIIAGVRVVNIDR